LPIINTSCKKLPFGRLRIANFNNRKVIGTGEINNKSTTIFKSNGVQVKKYLDNIYIIYIFVFAIYNDSSESR
jgi:hypothetical protein